MTTDTTYVIVGAGVAGPPAHTAAKPNGPMGGPPRPRGSRLGRADREPTSSPPPRWYAEHDIDLRLGVAVTGIDPATHQVSLADGSRAGYAKLLLATGSSPRRLSVPGAGLDGVLSLRTAGDSDQMKETLRSASHIVAIGGGCTGLETAAAARAAGPRVTRLEMAELPLLRVLGPP